MNLGTGTKREPGPAVNPLAHSREWPPGFREEEVNMTRSSEAAWRALRRPVTMREAAKLLGVSFAELEARRDGYRLLTIRVGRRRLVPVSELKKHRE